MKTTKFVDKEKIDYNSDAGQLINLFVNNTFFISII